MKVLISGASGLIGSRLIPFLEERGHEVLRLVRREPKGPGEVRWDPAAGTIDSEALAGVEAAVHLSGASIAEGRWTAARKKLLLDSRIDSTSLLAKTLAGLEPKPKVFLSCSAIGYYGDRGDEALTERSAKGGDFLCDLCEKWEQAAKPAKDAGIRVVHPRIGVVFAPEGGALAKMLFPIKMFVGGPLGNGRQYMGWISMLDILGAFEFLMQRDDIEGPVNLAAPQPATNKEVTKAIGLVLGRPAIFPVPGFVLRLMLGEMADLLLLASQKVVPERLREAGYEFKHPELTLALAELIHAG